VELFILLQMEHTKNENTHHGSEHLG